jgi:pimeloyl-ACP methyl ester carboxylesterase
MPTTRVNGLEIGYDRVGNGPALVLAHGGASDAREWEPQLAGLADELTVVAWDEPGAGRSSDLPADDFGLGGVADTFTGLIEALDLAPAHVGGLSWGGTIALEVYRRRPDLVGSLILCDTYAGWAGSLPAEEVDARLAGVPADLESTDWVKDALPGLFSDDPPSDAVAALDQVMAGARPRTLAHTMRAMAATDLSELLPRIDVPTLLIWGEGDARSPAATVARTFHEAIPRSQLVLIADAGHMSNLERPELFNRAVRDFCRANPLA